MVVRKRGMPAGAPCGPTPPFVLGTALLLGFVVTLAACERERRDFILPAARHAAARDAVAFRDPSRGLQGLVDPFQGSAWAVAEGERLYEWFNCVGCHAHGGGAIGPPLTRSGHMIGGGSPEAIFAVIVGGTPAGMPAYGGRLTEAEAWKIVAYVRSLGGNTVAPPRNDEMQAMRGATGGMSGPLPSPSDLDVLRAAEDEALGRYGWVDRKAGVVRIPIERAMELLTKER